MGKEIKMNGQKEPTREELMDYVQQLQNQNQALITKLNEVNNFTMFMCKSNENLYLCTQITEDYG